MEANDGIDKEAAIFWRDKKGKFNISIMRPSVLQRLKVNRLNPEIPLGAEILGKWEPRQSLNLPGNADFKAGFYRVKELTDANITVIPENSVTKQMAEALGFDKKEITNPEHRLGKGELEKILTTS